MVDPKGGGAGSRPGPPQGPKGGGGASPRPGPPQGPKGGGGGGGGAGPRPGPPQAPKPAPAVGLQLPIVQTYAAEEDLAFFITATDGSTALQGKSVGTGRDGGAGQGVCGLSDVGTGVQGDSGSGVGVFGNSNTQAGVLGTSKQLDGVQGQSQSAQHAGVSGVNHSGGMGVYGFSSNLDGVQGISAAKDHAGVSGTNNSGGMGVYGFSSSLDGVQGISAANDHAGVKGVNNKGGPGVSAASQGGPAIDATSQGGIGVVASGALGGVYATSAQGTAIVGQTSSGHAAEFTGPVLISGDLTLSTGNLKLRTGDVILAGGDCAEEFDIAATAEVEPGTVMVLTDNGALEPSQEAYDRKVAGVISGAGEHKPGLILGRRNSLRERRPLALVGKVCCKADAQFGPIAVRDLLTTSPTPGYAMKAADPNCAFGAVIGKALQPLAEGRGLIPILIALQ